MIVSFTFTKVGKLVTFRSTSREVPADSVYLWDFGDYGENNTSNEINPSHEYSLQGFYLVTLTVTPPDVSEVKPLTQKLSLGISDMGYPTLSDSIYNILDSYIPDELIPAVTLKDKTVYIQKWQLYLQPLVDHVVSIEDYDNEFAYKPLENQLITELAAYDWLMTGIMNLMRSTSSAIQDSTSGGESSIPVQGGDNGNVKKITTGPTEVEFFDNVLDSESASSLAKTLTSAMQPGGIIDNIKINLCMLAERLSIFLPICNYVRDSVVPSVSNRRRPGPLGGPNPRYPIKK